MEDDAVVGGWIGTEVEFLLDITGTRSICRFRMTKPFGAMPPPLALAPAPAPTSRHVMVKVLAAFCLPVRPKEKMWPKGGVH